MRAKLTAIQGLVVGYGSVAMVACGCAYIIEGGKKIGESGNGEDDYESLRGAVAFFKVEIHHW